VNYRLECVLAAAAALLVALAVACGDDAGPDPTPAAASTPELRGKVTVFAAASLTDAFNELKTQFTRLNPRVEVEYNFGGSPTLRTQLEQGARADVYASADQAQMNLASQNGVVTSTGKVFVRNSLVIVTPKDNRARISTPADLRRPSLKLVLANADVPVGAYARQSLAAMERDPAFGQGFADAVLKNVVSLESNVKQVVAKVELGEADGGIVYGTDITPALASKLTSIAIPAQFNVIAEYPIALVKGAGNARAGQAFIDFVLSPAGQAVLKKYGFQTVS
jgi:molybdate transport system substrate-binding protein